MQLGFVSAILPDLSLEDVFAFAKVEDFACVEVMCWPPGGAERRYAGVTHLDVTTPRAEFVRRAQEVIQKTGVAISALGYYPNPLDADPAHRKFVTDHLRKVLDAAVALGLGVVNTFIGRDHRRSIDDNWTLLRETWPPLVKHAESLGIKIGIEHCPMLFSNDEWPGGKNLAIAPGVWQRLFEEIPSKSLGLNFDPSHLVWQFIDNARAIREFGPRIVHFHAKDERIDHDRLYREGILGLGWHKPKLPGLGDVDWPSVFAALTDTGYNGPVCIEVEDRAYERNLDDRKRSLRQSATFLRQWVS
jgi:sugar phosphate isomerase/epimerase